MSARDPSIPQSTGPDRSLRTASDVELASFETFHSLFSSLQRAGRWEVPDELEARAVFGSVKLDLTRAELPPGGEVEIDAAAVFGEVEIIVPDGADVELDGTPIFGSVEQHLRKKGAGERIREWVTGEREEALGAEVQPEPPFIRIRARAIFGSVKVKGR